MKMKIMIVLLLVVGLVGCGSYTPPKENQIDNKRVYELEYDDVWGKIVEWFAQNGTPIKNIDKTSGFISTDYGLLTSYDYMDCGEGGRQKDRRVTVNVLVSTDNQTTTVVINAFFTCHVKYTTPTLFFDERVNCVSSGVLENKIFSFIEGKPVVKKPVVEKPKKRRH
jgi:hypothetical protein